MNNSLVERALYIGAHAAFGAYPPSTIHKYICSQSPIIDNKPVERAKANTKVRYLKMYYRAQAWQAGGL
jgi:hypothetical protein